MKFYALRLTFCVPLIIMVIAIVKIPAEHHHGLQVAMMYLLILSTVSFALGAGAFFISNREFKKQLRLLREP